MLAGTRPLRIQEVQPIPQHLDLQGTCIQEIDPRLSLGRDLYGPARSKCAYLQALRVCSSSPQRLLRELRDQAALEARARAFPAPFELRRRGLGFIISSISDSGT